jgi:hypothetical protein
MSAKQIQKQEEAHEPPSLPKSLAPDQLAPRGQELRNIGREQHARNLKAARASELEGRTEKVSVTPAELKHLIHIRMREAQLTQAKGGDREQRMLSDEELQVYASLQPEPHTMGFHVEIGADAHNDSTSSFTPEESHQRMEFPLGAIMYAQHLSTDKPCPQMSNNAFPPSPRAVRLETLPLSMSNITEPASKTHSEHSEEKSSLCLKPESSTKAFKRRPKLT